MPLLRILYLLRLVILFVRIEQACPSIQGAYLARQINATAAQRRSQVWPLGQLAADAPFCSHFELQLVVPFQAFLVLGARSRV